LTANSISAPGGHHLIDHNKFEDFSRVLLGKNAFLMFQIDKILSQSVKQLQTMHADQACKKAFKLFKQFQEDRASHKPHSESVYLTNYVDQVVE